LRRMRGAHRGSRRKCGDLYACAALGAGQRGTGVFVFKIIGRAAGAVYVNGQGTPLVLRCHRDGG